MVMFLLVLALVLFLLAGLGVPSSRYNLIGFGLATLTVVAMIGKGVFPWH
jgi:hypothetical protein